MPIKVTTPAQLLSALSPGVTIDATGMVCNSRLDVVSLGTAAAPIVINGGTFTGCPALGSLQQNTAAIRIGGQYLTWNNLTSTHNEGTGVSLWGCNLTLNNPSVTYNGSNGVCSDNPGSGTIYNIGNKIVGGEIAYNNCGLPNPSWAHGSQPTKLINGLYFSDIGNEGGAGKQYWVRGFVMDGTHIHHNHGPWWHDGYGSDWVIQNCEVDHNLDLGVGEGIGIEIEIYHNGKILNCHVHDNQTADIAIAESDGVLIQGCTLGTLMLRAGNRGNGMPRLDNLTVQGNTIANPIVVISRDTYPPKFLQIINNVFATQAGLDSVKTSGATANTGNTVGTTPAPTPPIPPTPAPTVKHTSVTTVTMDGTVVGTVTTQFLSDGTVTVK